jgi:hypothetical protein
MSALSLSRRIAPGLRHPNRWKVPVAPCYPLIQRDFMQTYQTHLMPIVPASKRWSGWRARCICPRRHLRVLPIRTRPSLFGGD